MLRRLGASALIAATIASAAPLAQRVPAVTNAARPAISLEPWPDDEVLLAAKTTAQNRRLFQDGPPLEFTLASEFKQINRERTPNNGRLYPGVLTIDGADLPVKLGSRGHLRLKTTTCDFVPIRLQFAPDAIGSTVFDGQRALKLGTHCRDERESDQYVIREYLSYKLTNLVTPFSFRARLARATYVDAKSKNRISTHAALFLEPEGDVARRLSGREARLPHMVFRDFDQDALTAAMLIEYMLGNTDYSIWALHNVIVVQDKQRKFYPVPYDFDSSGMVNPPYAAPDPRLAMLHSVTDRLYRGPCRTLDQMNAALEPFRAHQAEMMAVVESSLLNGIHKRKMKEYLDSFFRRIATPDAVKKTFVDGCPANRSRV